MTPPLPDDEQLALAVLARRPDALAEFVRRFRPIFLRDVRRIGRRLGPEAAEDLVQEIFVRLLRDDMRALRSWRPAGGRSLRTFLSWSARHQARSAVRAQRGRAWRELSPAGADAPGAHDPARETEDRQLARLLLQGLPAADQRLVCMLFVDEVPAEEASRALGLSRDGLYKRKQRALERLRALAGLAARRRGRPAGPARVAA